MNNFLSKALWHICFLDDGGEKYKGLVIGLFKPHPHPFFFCCKIYNEAESKSSQSGWTELLLSPRCHCLPDYFNQQHSFVLPLGVLLICRPRVSLALTSYSKSCRKINFFKMDVIFVIFYVFTLFKRILEHWLSLYAQSNKIGKYI